MCLPSLNKAFSYLLTEHVLPIRTMEEQQSVPKSTFINEKIRIDLCAVKDNEFD